jgi:hypothetical protein
VLQDEVVIRAANPADVEACGRIIYEAFNQIAEQHRFPPDFPTLEAGTHHRGSASTGTWHRQTSHKSRAGEGPGCSGGPPSLGFIQHPIDFPVCVA